MNTRSNTFFITGTNTEVGKTWCTCGLLESAKQLGLSTLAIKPIASGCYSTEQGLQSQDALDLMACMTKKLPYAQVNPYAIEPAIAPHIGANRLKINIEAAPLAEHCLSVIKTWQPDITFIEGAGGWRIPINSQQMLSDFVKILDISVILVVNMQIGCLNHAILTAEAILSDGLSIAGWIANTTTSQMNAYQENINTLAKRIPAPLLANIPRLTCFNKTTLAEHINLNLLSLY